MRFNKVLVLFKIRSIQELSSDLSFYYKTPLDTKISTFQEQEIGVVNEEIKEFEK